MKIDYHSSKNDINVTSSNMKAIEQSDCIVKTEKIVDVSKSIQSFEDISDDELVAMAIQLELKHPE